MKSQVIGTTMPVLEFLLEPNDAVISEAGELSWMSPNVQMTTHTQFAGGGGLLGAFKRVVGGGSLFMTEYRAMGGNGELAFATRVPGHIVPVEVAPGYDYMIHRHGFLCATSAVQISVGFQQSLGAGIFGGDGFLLQKSPARHRMARTLRRAHHPRPAPGETLLVHPGHVGAFQPACLSRSPWCAGSRTCFSAATGCSSRCYRSGTHLAADPAHLPPRPPDPGIPAERAGAQTTEAGVLGGIVGSVLDGMNR